MGAFDEERYTKVQFHVRYLKEMLRDRNLNYEITRMLYVANHILTKLSKDMKRPATYRHLAHGMSLLRAIWQNKQKRETRGIFLCTCA